MIIDQIKFDDMKTKAEAFYKSLGEIYCPYFGIKIAFNAKGLEHLKFKSKNHARSQADQLMRLKLIHLAPKVLEQSRTLQGISRRKNFEYIRSDAKTEYILKDVSYFEFIAVLEDRQEKKRVKIIVKQIEDGPKYFWSIIPYWRIDKETHERRLYSGNLESE